MFVSSAPYDKLDAGLLKAEAHLASTIEAGFGGEDGEPFPNAAVVLSRLTKPHDGSLQLIKGGAITSSTHQDKAEAKREAFNSKGILKEVGCLKGLRLVFGACELGDHKGFAFYDRRLGRNAADNLRETARIGLDWNMGSLWIYGFNGPARHYFPQLGNATQFFHRGSLSGGACVNWILTMTCDVNETEMKWIMLEVAKFFVIVEALFAEAVSSE